MNLENVLTHRDHDHSQDGGGRGLTIYGVDRNGSLAGYKTASAP
jgi:hypothetical protein